MIQPFMYDIKQPVSTFFLVLAVMESRKSFIMVALVMFPLAVSADDFADALKEIKRLKPDINYNRTFCTEIAHGGREKIACQVKKVPTVAILVCRRQEDCKEDIRAEVNNRHQHGACFYDDRHRCQMLQRKEGRLQRFLGGMDFQKQGNFSTPSRRHVG